MNKKDIIQIAENYIENSEDNQVNKEIAISNTVVGMKIFNNPIFAFGDAEDELFYLLKQSSIIGGHVMAPKEWLPQAKTVISFFLPFNESVRKSNYKERIWPSEGWLHGRVEGQAFLNKLCQYLSDELQKAGYKNIIPSLDERFRSKSGHQTDSVKNNYHEEDLPFFSSNWSERHVAYISGLGTFGLSKGLITKKGVAGRFGSILTDLYIKPDSREYKDIYEYCSKCGDCVSQCPVKAISLENGKNHEKCSKFLDKIKEKFKPRYGCGKCQINVSCERIIP